MILDENKNETFVYIHINNPSNYMLTLLTAKLLSNKNKIKKTNIYLTIYSAIIMSFI